ncbi:MAG: MGMT family protein [Christensenellales bacterium]
MNWAAVSEIPPGRVATYGQIARLIGRGEKRPTGAGVLRDASLYGDYPCHRVVNHVGRLAPGWPEQAELLRDEGVPLRDNTHVDMRFQWREEDE